MADDQPAEGFSASLGNAIKEQITESIKNADVLSLLQKMVATTPEDEESEEIREKLQGVLAQYEAMPEEEKIEFVAQIKDILATKVAMKLDGQNLDFSGLEEAMGQAVMYNLMIVGAAALVFILIFVFFGYKLYRSLKDKEKKREEKKKAKMMKKKK